MRKHVLVSHVKTAAHAAAVSWKARQLGGQGAAQQRREFENMKAQFDSAQEKHRREWDARVCAVIWLAVHAVRFVALHFSVFATQSRDADMTSSGRPFLFDMLDCSFSIRKPRRIV